jgi:hypothetical protein
VVDCGNLGDPRNGRVDLTGTTFDSVATYSCIRDYTLEGPRTRRCQADGTWSGREPTCERKPTDNKFDNILHKFDLGSTTKTIASDFKQIDHSEKIVS